jgi:UDP-glucose 4-epimerase
MTTKYQFWSWQGLLKRCVDSRSEIVHLPALPEGDMTRRQPDIKKMECLLNRPFTTLEEGLKKILEERKK